jgi:hypothetical protein
MSPSRSRVAGKHQSTLRLEQKLRYVIRRFIDELHDAWVRCESARARRKRAVPIVAANAGSDS